MSPRARLVVSGLCASLAVLGLTVASAPTATASDSYTLSTEFSSGGIVAEAFTFDLDVAAPGGVRVNGLGITAADYTLLGLGTLSLDVYTRSGSAVGHEGSNTGWTLRRSVTVQERAAGQVTSVPVSFDLPAGKSAVRVVQTDVDSFHYMIGFTPSVVNNNHLTLTPRSLSEGGTTHTDYGGFVSVTYELNIATSIATGPQGLTTSNDPGFTYGATPADDVDHFECSLTPAPPGRPAGYGTCGSSAVSYADLPDGDYTFSVRAIAKSGSRPGSVASRNFTVDTVAPDTSLESGPTGASTSTSAAFTYAGVGDVDHLECDLAPAEPGGAPGFAPCDDTNVTYANLPDADYTFSVRAVDAAGNADPTPATRGFTVDTTGPETTVATGPTDTTDDPNPAFTYTATDADVDHFECDLAPAEPGGSAGFEPCANEGLTYTDLPDEEYTFSVRAVDVLGNADPTPATREFDLNATSPTITATLSSAIKPTANWYRAPVVIRFACDPGDSTLTTACPAPVTLSNNGARQTVTRQVTTADGDTATSTTVVSIDRTLPQARVSGFSTARVHTRKPVVRCVATDALSGMRSCVTKVTINAARTRVVVTARATDKAGNVRLLTLSAPYRGR